MIKTKILPPTYFLILLLITVVLHIMLPIAKIIFFPINMAGVILIIFGVVINIWADSIFKRERTTVKPFEKPAVLIVKGPFSFSRHPMYLGFVSILLGTSILLGSLSTFIIPIILFFILKIKFITHEEKTLEKIFGQKYRDYKKQVGEWR